MRFYQSSLPFFCTFSILFILKWRHFTHNLKKKIFFVLFVKVKCFRTTRTTVVICECVCLCVELAFTASMLLVKCTCTHSHTLKSSSSLNNIADHESANN